jgi:type I restriction enzyme R subunit
LNSVIDETPKQLDTPGKRALYNNLKTGSAGVFAVADEAGAYVVEGDQALAQALKIDAAVRLVRPDDWRGIQAREQVVKGALYGILKDQDEVERIFKIIFQQREY